MKLLRIDSSILGQNSASRELSKRVVERLMEADSSIELIYRDLSRDHLPHLGLGALPGTHPLAAAAGALIPLAGHGGRPRKTDMRAAMNAIFYLLRTDAPLALPATRPAPAALDGLHPAHLRHPGFHSIRTQETRPWVGF